MNSSMTALMLFLAAAVLFQTQAQPVQDSKCCISYVRKPIPLKLLARFEVKSRCSLPAIVFYTKLNKKFCADPHEPWTQDRMRQLSENRQPSEPLF